MKIWDTHKWTFCHSDNLFTPLVFFPSNLWSSFARRYKYLKLNLNLAYFSQHISSDWACNASNTCINGEHLISSTSNEHQPTLNVYDAGPCPNIGDPANIANMWIQAITIMMLWLIDFFFITNTEYWLTWSIHRQIIYTSKKTPTCKK